MAGMKPFRLMGANGYMALEFSSWDLLRPDGTTRMGVTHHVLDEPVDVRLTERMIPALVEWLEDSSDEALIYPDGPAFASLRKFPSGYATVKCQERGSGRSRTVALSAEDLRTLRAWLGKLDRQGWTTEVSA